MDNKTTRYFAKKTEKIRIKPFFSSDSKSLPSVPEESATETKINSFSNYKSGWSYGKGIQFSRAVIEDALRIVKIIHGYGFTDTCAFPGENGEIMIIAYKNEFYCEVIAYENIRYDFVIEKHDNEITIEENINFTMLNKLIEEFKDMTIMQALKINLKN